MAQDPQQSRPITLITGGSEGLGKALAFEFAKGGYDLVLVARSKAKLERAASELREAFDISVDIIVMDLSRANAGADIAQQLTQRGLHVHILVNNAGLGLAGAFKSHTPEELTRMLDVNIRAVSDLTSRFLPGMIERKAGGILNISSLGGVIAGPYQAAYYASKAYVHSLSRALRVELWGKGVRISVFMPGPIATRFHARMGASRAVYLKMIGALSPERAARVAYCGFQCGQLLIVPGLLNLFYIISIKFIPHTILEPFLGWMLRYRLVKNENV